ncbi:MAG: glucose-6-phosphate dehydrogenase [Ilumatobacteraceae bacterium]
MDQVATDQVATGGDRSDAFVFFGATGDLAFRQIFPALHGLIRDDGFDLPIIGVARSGDLATLRERARRSVEASGPTDPVALERLLDLLHYVKGSHDDPETFHALRGALGDAEHPLHYLAIPPALFGQVIANLQTSGCATGARVIVEKPFGRDLGSARALNHAARAVFPEAAIFRIDHYLGKEPIQNLVYFRFANSFLEPIWNRDRIASVQITLAEALDVGSRGAFYDGTGALRDVVQNHLFQVLALLAMEPPAGRSAEAMANEKFKILDSIRPLRPDDVVRGQYSGYRDTDGVAVGSTVETFAAVRLEIGTWRWGGVPFTIRTGKSLAATATEVIVSLRPPPQAVFGDDVFHECNYIRFQFDPGISISIGARTKLPGEAMVGEPVELVACNRHGDGRPPYERLIGDATNGDQTLFARQDAVEAAWRVVEGILDDRSPLHEYEPGSWGPPQADRLLAAGERWHAPRVAHLAGLPVGSAGDR